MPAFPVYFTFTPGDHNGLEKNAFVMVKIENGTWTSVEITNAGDVRVAEAINSSLTLRFAVTGPHPNPRPLRQGRENLNSVTIYRISLPCRSGEGWGGGRLQQSGG